MCEFWFRINLVSTRSESLYSLATANTLQGAAASLIQT